MEKKQPRKRKPTILQRLREWVAENAITDEEIIEERFYKCIEEPDPQEAVAFVKRAKFRRFIASIRNKEGLRMAFIVKSSEGNRQVHIIPGTPDLEAVAKVEKRLAMNQKGNGRTRQPVRRYQKKLVEQTILLFATNGENSPQGRNH